MLRRNRKPLSGIWKHVEFSCRNENQGVHVEISVRPPSPLNTYSYIQEENLDSTRILFRKSKKVLDIFEKPSCLYGCRSIQSKKEIHSNRKFGYHCFCIIKKPNKNFLKLKCDWWCLYFDATDGYLRFIPTDGQMTIPFCVSGCNLIDKGTRQKT